MFTSLETERQCVITLERRHALLNSISVFSTQHSICTSLLSSALNSAINNILQDFVLTRMSVSRIVYAQEHCISTPLNRNDPEVALNMYIHLSNCKNIS